MQRYFLENKAIVNNQIIIDGNDYHHIKNVMRMVKGEKVYICLNEETYIASLNSFFDDYILFDILDKVGFNPEMFAEVTIAHGLVRREKKEEVLRRIVELGANKYIPVNMARSVVKPCSDENKLERQKKIIKEASEQSHRNKLMEVCAPISMKELINLSKDYDLSLFAYEESGRSNDFSLKDKLREFRKNNKKNILVLVGPEGGFTNEEVKLLCASGFFSVGLGPRILRTETAPLYVMAAISYELEMGD